MKHLTLNQLPSLPLRRMLDQLTPTERHPAAHTDRYLYASDCGDAVVQTCTFELAPDTFSNASAADNAYEKLRGRDNKSVPAPATPSARTLRAAVAKLLDQDDLSDLFS